jgi:hypothetical protein
VALSRDLGGRDCRPLTLTHRKKIIMATLRNAVLCHGETIGRLLTELVAEGLVLEDRLDWPKGSTWLLQRTDQGQVYGRLLAPLALEGLHLAEP